MILNEQLNNTVWQIEASELAYDATQGAFTATITPAIDIDGTYTVIVPKGTFNIVSTEDGTTPEQIVDNMSASVNVVFSADARTHFRSHLPKANSQKSHPLPSAIPTTTARPTALFP